MKLACAEICRDGGSITADFELEDGGFLSLLLEVACEDSLTTHYLHLHAGDKIQNCCNPLTIIAKGTPEEARILLMLNVWAESISPQDQMRYESGELRKVSMGVDASLYWALELKRELSGRSG